MSSPRRGSRRRPHRPTATRGRWTEGSLAGSGSFSRLFQEIDEGKALLTDLFRRSAPERSVAVVEETRFQALGLCELLQARSQELWFSDPAAAVDLAELAVAVAGRLDEEHYGRALVEDARALAWGHLGNARRIASDLRKAEEALQTSEQHLALSDADAHTEAQILSFKASLRNSQGRFDEATQLLDRVIAIYRDARDRHLEGKALIKKGMVMGDAGRHRPAVRLLRQGLSRIVPFEEPALLVSARHNLILYLHESGRNAEAESALVETRGLYDELGQPTHRIRLGWLAGKIARDLGRLDEAETVLRQARDAFIAQGIGFDAALVALDLALVHVRKGDRAEIKHLAAEMVPIFQSRDVHAEAAAALVLFQNAAEAEEVTEDLVRQMAAYLQRARHDPDLRFAARKRS